MKHKPMKVSYVISFNWTGNEEAFETLINSLPDGMAGDNAVMETNLSGIVRCSITISRLEEASAMKIFYKLKAHLYTNDTHYYKVYTPVKSDDNDKLNDCKIYERLVLAKSYDNVLGCGFGTEGSGCGSCENWQKCSEIKRGKLQYISTILGGGIAYKH